MTDIEAALARLARQEQFLDVVSSDEATARFHRHLKLRPLGSEPVPLSQALDRVLAQARHRRCRCSRFRSRQRRRVCRARQRHRRRQRAGAEDAAAERRDPDARASSRGCRSARASRRLIATGGMVPRGADAVVMVEHTETREVDGKTRHRDPPSRGSRASSSPLPAAIWRAAKPFCAPARC